MDEYLDPHNNVSFDSERMWPVSQLDLILTASSFKLWL